MSAPERTDGRVDDGVHGKDGTLEIFGRARLHQRSGGRVAETDRETDHDEARDHRRVKRVTVEEDVRDAEADKRGTGEQEADDDDDATFVATSETHHRPRHGGAAECHHRGEDAEGVRARVDLGRDRGK